MSKGPGVEKIELRRSECVKNKSGQEVQFEGKYCETQFEEEAGVSEAPFSAKCLSYTLLKNQEREKEKVVENDSKIVSEKEREKFLSAFKASGDRKTTLVKKKKYVKTNERIQEQCKGSQKITIKSNPKRKSLYRSETIEDLSDSSVDNTPFKVVESSKQKKEFRRKKRLNTCDSDSEETCEEIVWAPAATEKRLVIQTASLNYNSVSKETDYDTCDSTAEDSGTINLKEVRRDKQQLTSKDQIESRQYCLSGTMETNKEGNSCENNTSLSNWLLCSGSYKSGETAKQKSMPTMEPSNEQPTGLPEWKTMLLTLQSSIDKIGKDLNEDKTSREKAIKEAKTAGQQVSDELKGLKTEVTGYKNELKLLKDTIIRQDQEIKECKAEIEQLQLLNMKPNLIIGGLIRNEDENCKEVVMNFFSNVLKIEQEIKIKNAYRLGKGKKAPMFITVRNADEKFEILKKAINLKDVTNSQDEKYSIEEQLPNHLREEKRRRRTLIMKNKTRTVDKLVMSFDKGKLMVNDREYAHQVKPPSMKTILTPTHEQLKDRGINIDIGRTIKKGKSSFTGYAASVENIKQVNSAYAKVRACNALARHIMCAFRIPHESWHTHEDYQDDNEHTGGKILLDALINSEIFNKVIFVARNYEGEHIGTKKFEGIMEAAKAVMTQYPFNPVTGENQFLWSSEQKKAYGNAAGFNRQGRGAKSGIGRQAQ